MAFGGAASRRRRLGSLAIAAVIGALLTDTLAGPVLGAIPTSKFLVLWALFTLIMMAVAFATAALQTLLGAGGTLVVVIVFVIFGAPSSGGTVPASYLPTPLANDRPLPPGRRRHDRRTEHHLLRRQPDRDRPCSSSPPTSSSERSPCFSSISGARRPAQKPRRRPPRRRPSSRNGAGAQPVGRQGVLGGDLTSACESSLSPTRSPARRPRRRSTATAARETVMAPITLLTRTTRPPKRFFGFSMRCNRCSSGCTFARSPANSSFL